MLLFGIIVTVLFFISWVIEDNKKYLEELARNKKKSSKNPNNIPTQSKNNNLKLVKEENKKKPLTLKQKNFIKELVARNDYAVIERILIDNKLINKLSMEVASNIISHILEVERYEDNKIQNDEMFLKRFPLPLEKKKASEKNKDAQRKKVVNKSVKLKCLGLTKNRKRCVRLVKYPKYFCELHSNDYKEYDFADAIAREYFYRSHCQKFLSNLFELLTLESKENNFKLEGTIKSIIKDHLGVKEFNNLIKKLAKKSFKDLFFDFTFFNVFTSSLVGDYPFMRAEFWCFECSIDSFKNNDLCYEHNVYSDFHLLYEFGFYPNETFSDAGEFYLELNKLVIKNDFSELIENYYLSVKNYNLNDSMLSDILDDLDEELFGDN